MPLDLHRAVGAGNNPALIMTRSDGFVCEELNREDEVGLSVVVFNVGSGEALLRRHGKPFYRSVGYILRSTELPARRDGEGTTAG